MRLVRAQDEKGLTVPAPYERTIKILLAPDREDVPEMMFSHVGIAVGSHTDYHTHDRPELIYIVSGKGISVCEGKEDEVGPGTALWILAEEKHELKNTGDEVLEIVTVFVPGYTAESQYKACVERAKQG